MPRAIPGASSASRRSGKSTTHDGAALGYINEDVPRIDRSVAPASGLRNHGPRYVILSPAPLTPLSNAYPIPQSSSLLPYPPPPFLLFSRYPMILPSTLRAAFTVQRPLCVNNIQGVLVLRDGDSVTRSCIDAFKRNPGYSHGFSRSRLSPDASTHRLGKAIRSASLFATAAAAAAANPIRIN